MSTLTHQGKSRAVIFIVTNLVAQSLYGYFCVYSSIKYSMIKSLSLTAEFIGTLQSTYSAGYIICSFITLFLIIRAKKFCLYGSILGLVTSLIFFPLHYIDNQNVVKMILVVLFFCRSVFDQIHVFIFLLFVQNFKQQQNQGFQSIWYLLSSIGSLIGLIYAYLMVHKLCLRWDYVMIIWHIIMLCLNILLQITIEDVKICKVQQLVKNELQKQQNEKKQEQLAPIGEHDCKIFQAQPQRKEKQKAEIVSQVPFCIQLKILAAKMWELLKQPRILLFIVCSKLTLVPYTIMLYWILFYYQTINYKQYSTLALFSVDTSLFIGGISIQLVLIRLFSSEKNRKFAVFLFFILSFVALTVLWTNKESSIVFQLVLIFVYTFLFAPHYSRIYMCVGLQVCENDQAKLEILTKLSSFVSGVFDILAFFLIGIVMERSPISFWTVIWGITLISILFQCMRQIYEKKYVNHDLQKQLKHENERNK